MNGGVGYFCTTKNPLIMTSINLGEFKEVEFGENCNVISSHCVIEQGVVFGDNVTIIAKNIYIGRNSKIEKNTVVKSISKDSMDTFYLGDNCFIGYSSQILLPEFIMLDYSQLHNTGLHSGYKKLNIGYNCWIGQNTILNATEELIIKNNVRIGTQSQLWTHVASGELFEGCTLFGSKPLVLNDDVWIVGGGVISPGLVLAKKSVIMTGSVLTKSTEEKHTYAGVPAKDVTDKLHFWKELSHEEKVLMIQKYMEEFLLEFPMYESKIKFTQEELKDEDYLKNDCMIISEGQNIDWHKCVLNGSSIFDISNKHYYKTKTQIETDWIKFNVGYRIRFIPK